MRTGKLRFLAAALTRATLTALTACEDALQCYMKQGILGCCTATCYGSIKCPPPRRSATTASASSSAKTAATATSAARAAIWWNRRGTSAGREGRSRWLATAPTHSPAAAGLLPVPQRA